MPSRMMNVDDTQAMLRRIQDVVLDYPHVQMMVVADHEDGTAMMVAGSGPTETLLALSLIASAINAVNGGEYHSDLERAVGTPAAEAATQRSDQ